MQFYNVYVIELDKRVLNNKKFIEKNPDYQAGKPCVYVGQTAKSPEERFQQHKSGFRANRFVKKLGLKLKENIFKRHNPMTSRAQAESKEAWLAENLRKKGYAVWWN